MVTSYGWRLLSLLDVCRQMKGKLFFVLFFFIRKEPERDPRVPGHCRFVRFMRCGIHFERSFLLDVLHALA
jgi:hypothetical protein